MTECTPHSASELLSVHTRSCKWGASLVYRIFLSSAWVRTIPVAFSFCLKHWIKAENTVLDVIAVGHLAAWLKGYALIVCRAKN